LQHRNKANKLLETSNLSLHLGCGEVYLPGWVNIDANPRVVADVICDFQSIGTKYDAGSVSKIKMVHSISYLRLWEAQVFFKTCYRLLHTGGKFILEFPDIAKCAKIIVEHDGSDYTQYLESVRAFYAFDMEQIKCKKLYQPYAFGWSAEHIRQELLNAGFSIIDIKDGTTHGRPWRDTNVEATK
jgi:predicted SAM-dependent methyltransferase